MVRILVLRTKLAPSLALAVLSAAALCAQNPPAFEVASVKVSRPDSQGGVTVNPGEIVWTKATLNELVKTAFNVKDYSLSAPAWLDSGEFDVTAKMPAGTPPGQLPMMLQALLVERFKLAYHFESRTTNGYALVIAKDGLKIRPADGGQQRSSVGPDRLMAKNTSLAQFANMLSVRLDRPVQDSTGIAGVFDFDLKWTRESGAPNMTPGAPTDAATDFGPSLFTALQEQLGLKLEARKLPVDVLVIDHAEKVPIEN